MNIRRFWSDYFLFLCELIVIFLVEHILTDSSENLDVQSLEFSSFHLQRMHFWSQNSYDCLSDCFDSMWREDKEKTFLFERKVLFLLFLILNRIVLHFWFDYLLTSVWIFIVLDLKYFWFLYELIVIFLVERNLLWFEIFETFH